MDSVRVIERGDLSEASDMAIAKQVGEALMKAYPNHPWIVGVQGGGLIVRHMAIANAVTFALGKEGFSSLLPRNKLGTPTEITKTAVRFGGELLEAFGMKRGAWDGSEPIVPIGWNRRKTSGFQ